MSRRTKYISTAIFLVLLAIPTVYAVLTWRPENPLRFRVVDYEEPPRDGSDLRDAGKLHMIVENTSSVPVHLFSATLEKVDDPDLAPLRSDGSFVSYWKVYLPRGGGIGLTIPAHTSLPCFSPVPQDEYPASALENIELSYRWISGTRHKAGEAHNWLLGKAPASVRLRFPLVEKSLDEDTTPLQLALPIQGQSQSVGR